MKVEIISKEIIKPSFLIPNKQRTYKLSLIDQLAPPCYFGCVFFYDTIGFREESSAEKSEHLRSSLSETLTEFWPFAGRVDDNFSIIYDENDGGVEYCEARVFNPIYLSDILKKPEEENLKLLSPDVTLDYGTRPLFLVRASFFECGGISLGICISHKISDGSTYVTLLNNWARKARGCLDKKMMTVGGNFDLSSNLFPPAENMLIKASVLSQVKPNGVTKRFVLTASNIATLQNKASDSVIKRPTRVEAVMSLLWKTAMVASRSRMGSTTRPSASLLTINLRKIMSLFDHSIGNFFGTQTIQTSDIDIELSKLVYLVQGAIGDMKKYRETEIETAQRVLMFLGDAGSLENLKLNKDMSMYVISSWSRFPIYEVDFGWGSPIWVGMPSFSGIPNCIILMDTKDGTGIEAWVNLVDEEMNLFETNKELLTFASLNPSVHVVNN